MVLWCCASWCWCCSPLDCSRAGAKPDLSKFLDPLFDALEPDSGVEAEFHPSNNPVGAAVFTCVAGVT